MSPSVQAVIDSFNRLSAVHQQEVASHILRRVVQVDLPPLDDETLAHAAEEIFLQLDEQETADGRPKAR